VVGHQTVWSLLGLDMAARSGHGASAIGETLLSYKLPSEGGKDSGFDGIIKWKRSEQSAMLIRRFRHAVLKKDLDTVKCTITAFKPDMHEDDVGRLSSLLLDRSSAEPTKEALMTAICIGSRPLVEFILSLFYEFPQEECNGCKNSIAYPSHMTPLMLAAICNNFAIVQCLLLRNHRICLPHRPDCLCSECRRIARGLSKSVVTLDTYRAISSAAFLWLACSDPSMAAFRLAADLEICMEYEQDHRMIYQQLHHNVMAFGVRLVQQCWNMEEVDLLLSRMDGAPLSYCQIRLPRLRVALDCGVKNLLSTLNAQIAVQAEWCGGWTDYGSDVVIDTWRHLKHTFLYPITASIHTFTAGFYVRSFNYPVARYISEMASYVLFLFVLLLIRLSGRKGDHAAERSIKENPRERILEVYAYLYAIGMAFRHYISLSNRGMSAFYDVWWTWFDLILLWLLSGTAFCWVMTAASVSQDGLSKLHRKHWISITRCVYDVIIFLTIMAVVMMCFAMGISCIYQPYTGNVAVQSDDSLVQMKETFSGIIITLRNLYWSFYGYLGPWDYKLIVGNAGPNYEQTEHLFTMIAGESIVAVFHITVVVTLLNLMVSLLVRKADEVQRNEDCEWKYTRCHIYTDYFDWYSAVPPPFNIAFIFIRLAYQLVRKEFKFIYPGLLVDRTLIEAPENERLTKEINYQTLLRTLFDRYRSSAEYHYSDVLKSDGDQCLGNIQGEKNIPQPIFMFMDDEKTFQRLE
uniref:Transient receptor ion channel domain-containing protein n=2 Tax=Parascaris univalens TaxID=6257 RepID=A0A915BS31_PARUN